VIAFVAKVLLATVIVVVVASVVTDGHPQNLPDTCRAWRHSVAEKVHSIGGAK
jgi:hypothetical protein